MSSSSSSSSKAKSQANAKRNNQRRGRRPAVGQADPGSIARAPRSTTITLQANQRVRHAPNINYRIGRSSLSPAMQALGELYCNPAGGEPRRMPADFPVVGDVKTFTRVINFSAAQIPGAFPKNFHYVMRPSIHDFFEATAGVDFPVPPTAPGLYCSASGIDLQSNPSANNKALVADLKCVAAADGSEVVLSSTVISGRYCWQISGAGAYEVTLALQNGVKVEFWSLQAGVWVLDDTTSGAMPLNTYYVLPGAAYTAISINQTGNTALNPNPNLILDGSGAAWVIPADSNTRSLYSSDAITLGRVERARVTAMSMLVSYSGNMLNNGGVIAAARTQPHYIVTGNAYEALNLLQDHKYSGPLSTGAYCWWLPGAYGEMDFASKPVETTLQTALHCAGQFVDATGSVTVTLTATVEFYSPLQIFSHITGPESTPEYFALLHLLSLAPAATCNPSHLDVFKGLLTKARGAYRAGESFVQDHPEVLSLMKKALLALV